MRAWLFAFVAIAAVGCGGSNPPGADGDGGGSASDMAMAGRDAATGGGADLAQQGGGGGDMAATLSTGTSPTVSGHNCFYVSASGCSGGGGQYQYYCLDNAGPETGCTMLGDASHWCCPDQFCVSYTSSNAACTVNNDPPNAYSCPQGFAPNRACAVYSQSNGFYCCQ